MCSSVVGYCVARSKTIELDTYTKRDTSWASAARTTPLYKALLTSVSVWGSLWKLPMPPTIAARWMTCVQPRVALRASSRSRRSPWWTSQPSRIHCGASRWSETRTSKSGSRSRRRTTAAPMVPAPPVTRTLFMAGDGSGRSADADAYDPRAPRCKGIVVRRPRTSPHLVQSRTAPPEGVRRCESSPPTGAARTEGDPVLARASRLHLDDLAAHWQRPAGEPSSQANRLAPRGHPWRHGQLGSGPDLQFEGALGRCDGVVGMASVPQDQRP